MQMNSGQIAILVVDDSALERLMVGHVLRQDSRFIVTAVNGGQEALEYTAVHRPNLVVTDLRMPGMNGLELIENLRSAGQYIPVVLMTSFGSEELVVKALKAGAASYVPKLNLEHGLLKTIRRVLVLAEHRKHRCQTIDELTISEWCFALESDPDSVPYLISHLLNLAVQLNQTPGEDATRVKRALKRVLSIAAASGTLEIGGELREALEAINYSSSLKTTVLT